MKCRVASLAVAAGFVTAACSETPRPTEPINLEPSFSSSGSTTQCVGGLLPGTYDNIEVPRGQTCFINGSVIRGSVKALEDSRLNMNSNTVGGNVEGHKAAAVSLFNDDVKGSIIVKKGVLDPADFQCAAFVQNVKVAEGNIEVENTISPCVAVFDNVLRKGSIKIEKNHVTNLLRLTNNVAPDKIRVFKNTGPADKPVMNNQAGGVLQCFKNQLPFIGGPNPATARSEGQCF